MDNYSLGLELFKQGNFDKAIESFMLDKENPTRYFQIANCYLCKKDYDSALLNIEKAINEQVYDTKIYILKGLIQYEQGDKKGLNNVIFNNCSLLIKDKPTSDKFESCILSIILFLSWLQVNFAIYQQYLQIGFVDKFLYIFIAMQIYIVVSIILYKSPQFMLCAAFMSGLVTATQPLFKFLPWLCLIAQTTILGILGLEKFIVRDKKYLIFCKILPEMLEQYYKIGNYQTALNICNIALQYSPKEFGFGEYYNKYKLLLQQVRTQ